MTGFTLSKWCQRRLGQRNPSHPRPATRALSVEQLEHRRVLSITIDLHWEGDFFDDPARRAAVDAAAHQIADQLTTDLAAIPQPGNGQHKWTAYYDDPAAEPRRGVRLADPHIPANTLVVFVGARSLDSAAETCSQYSGPPRCGVYVLDHDWESIVKNRGQSQRFPWGGSIAFNEDVSWYAGPAQAKPTNQIDLYSLASTNLGICWG